MTIAARREARKAETTKRVDWTFRTYRMKSHDSWGCLLLANGRVVSNAAGFRTAVEAETWGDETCKQRND